MDRYYVYKHINKVNGKQYIGITRQLPENRWGVNGRNYRNKCPHFWNAIQKYGWDMFDHVVIASDLSKEDACAMEIALIREYKTQDRQYGYNTFEGGSAPSIPPDVREKMSRSMAGNKNGAGHPCSNEKRRKISEAQKGKSLTDEHRANISKAKAGKPHASPSQDTRKKISEAHVKTPVYCLEKDITYQSIQDCAKQLELYATNVCKCCKGKIKTTGGYHLQYAIQ